ncbi:methylated-DNA--[protein]-cysteine S-methyltransferase [Thiothrix winogradskyi]|uniref:Methylated-DNA--protein-cysteine methyltransferase n=1 Tax=Thiothrix winogradskyi TaxID=96472 RepID=A0ABY3T2E5_9GAMM|nr:methylated-DNA--[protein]-cysteine S-methyltransferase [Thiothrix winogradskyi]UJS25996.1 methylated-DNA--[protein]-cysteine S-methyltransferase [Thiothrix winogradskyi]
MNTNVETWESPVGILYIAATDYALCALAFDSNWQRIRATLGNVKAQSNALTQAAISQLQAYFAGTRRCFALPLELHGTDFQLRTWQALREIPYGKTLSYSEQAQMIGQPQAVRAIGHTNGLNPVSIIVPCHRVIAKSGKLAGYAGGLAAKEYLLALEAK